MTNAPSRNEQDESLFDALARLVPDDLQKEYYRVVAHTKSLSPNDEMLRILEVMGILALLTRHTPAEIAEERERLKQILDLHVQFAGDAQKRILEYVTVLEGRLAVLPSEVVDGLNPLEIAKLLGESLRQHFSESGIQETATALQHTASSLMSAQQRLGKVLLDISDPGTGIAARVDSVNGRMEVMLQTRVRNLDHLLGEFKSDLLQVWIPTIAVAALLTGLLVGGTIQGCRDASSRSVRGVSSKVLPLTPRHQQHS